MIDSLAQQTCYLEDFVVVLKRIGVALCEAEESLYRWAIPVRFHSLTATEHNMVTAAPVVGGVEALCHGAVSA